MSDIGIIPVDFEDRFDPKRMIRDRLALAKQALKNSDLDALFVFRTEDARYLMGYRHHLGPVRDHLTGLRVPALVQQHQRHHERSLGGVWILVEPGTNQLLGLIQHPRSPMSLGEHREFCPFDRFSHG